MTIEAEDTLQSLFQAYAAENMTDTDDLDHSDRIDLVWATLRARPELWSRVHEGDVTTLARWHQRLRTASEMGPASGAKAFLSAIHSALYRAIRPELDAGLRRAAERSLRPSART